MKRTALLLSLAIVALSAPQAMAQSSIGLRSLGASIGYVSPEDLDGTMGFGVFANMGQITPQIRLEPRIEFWSQSEEAFGTKASLRDVAVGARGKYFFETSNPKIRPFAGAGLGLHFLSAEATVSVPGLPTISTDESTTKLGLDFGGGMETNLNPRVTFHGELWYGIVSDASQFCVRLGLSRTLGS